MAGNVLVLGALMVQIATTILGTYMQFTTEILGTYMRYKLEMIFKYTTACTRFKIYFILYLLNAIISKKINIRATTNNLVESA